jgi:hypothetical protein
MTEKRVYLATTGPFIFDDTEDLDSYETGILANRKQAALTTDGSVLIAAGGDLIMEGSSSTPTILRFAKDTDHTVGINIEATGGYTNNQICFYPDTHNTGYFTLGRDSSANLKSFISIQICSGQNGIALSAFNAAGTYSTDLTIATTSGGNHTWNITDTGLQILNADHKVFDIGGASGAFDDIYADDFQNVADFFHLDDRDDLATLEQIKGSGHIDPSTRLEIIDDSTLPEWMLTKDKKSGDIARDPEGKPYLSMRMVTSLVMGACRQLNKKIEELESKIAVLKF